MLMNHILDVLTMLITLLKQLPALTVGYSTSCSNSRTYPW